MNIIITRNGEVRYLAVPGSECFEVLGEVRRQRVSHILPKSPFKRWAFLVLRQLFGESGHVAAWTRTWNTTWTVSWAETPYKIEFESDSRKQCVTWEERQLGVKHGF